MDHLIDTEIKIKTCVRCGAYVMACQVSGLKIACDPQPLDVDGYRAALIAGRRTYSVVELNGRPWKLRASHPSTPAGRLQVAAHVCGAHGQDATEVQEPLAFPLRAPVSAGRSPRAAPVLSGAQMPDARFSVVHDAIPPRSDLTCERCRTRIKEGEPHWAIDHPAHRWAVHDHC